MSETFDLGISQGLERRLVVVDLGEPGVTISVETPSAEYHHGDIHAYQEHTVHQSIFIPAEHRNAVALALLGGMTDDPITISASLGIALLDYLDNAESDLAEYGAPSSAFDELDQTRRDLHMALYGAPAPPTVQAPPPPRTPEQIARDEQIHGWMQALASRRAPLLSWITIPLGAGSAAFQWGSAPPPTPEEEP